jgi:thiol-disulfide isomerase/thioredoxin
MDLLSNSAGRLATVALLLAVASLVLLLARRRDGVLRAPGRRERVTAAELGRALGATATLLQVSSPGCATCPQVARVLGAVAREHRGVAHVEIDATRYPDLVRRLGVLRTPSVLLLGPDGDVRARTSGSMDRAAATAALDLAVARG